MSQACVLGIDVGTSSCKVCAVASDGILLGVASAPYPILSPFPGWAEQDAREWFPAVETALGRLFGALTIPRSGVGGLALSSAAHIAVLLDDEGESLRPAILWNDQRAGAESICLVEEMGDLIFSQTCNQASPTWTFPQLLWVREHEPDVWRRVRRICLSKDHVIRRITGRLCTDPAAAVSSLLYDVRGGRWSPELCGRLGIGVEMLPDVVSETEPAGMLLPTIADRLGLPRGIPVFPGTLDSVAETYCAGAVREGDCIIRLGTGGGVQILRPGPAGHPKLISYPFPVAPLWLSQAGTNACGASIDWVGRALGGGSSASPEELSRLAATVPPGSDGVLFHPYLLGERCPHWDAALRGSFVGLSLGHGLAHLARAVLEGVAYSLKDASSIFQEGEGWPRPRMMTVVGGGTRSATLVRILCDVFGQPMRINPDADSAYGAALLALQSVAGFAGRTDARIRERDASIMLPDPEASWRYADGLAAFRTIYERLRGYYRDAARNAG